MARLQMLSPWMVRYHEIDVMFKNDPEVHVVLDEENNEVKLFVENARKAYALSHLLPEVVPFGTVELKITVIQPNTESFETLMIQNSIDAERPEELLRIALVYNPALVFVDVCHGIYTSDIVYVVFANEVVQYYNDDLGDYYGQCSTLYQNIAEHIFKPLPNVHYCTYKRVSPPVRRPITHRMGTYNEEDRENY